MTVRYWSEPVSRQWYRVPAQIYHFSYVIKQVVIMLFSVDLNQERWLSPHGIKDN